jgi:diguanylate cyclase (GGDEF)-like protein
MDPRTLLFSTLMLVLCSAAGLWLMSRADPELRGLRWFVLAFLSLGLGITPDFSHPAGPTVVNFTRGLVLLSIVLYTQGVAEFVNEGARTLAWGGSLIVAAMLGQALVLAAGGGRYAPAAIALFTLPYAAQTGVAAALLLAHSVKRERAACRATAAMMLGTALIMLLRNVFVVSHVMAAPLLIPSPVRSVTITIFVAMNVGMAFGVLWMTIARQQYKLERQSHTDALTGVLNRRALEATAEELIAACRARGAALSVLALDLDHFKQLNDAHGHAGGDAVLIAAARLLAESLRATDVVARFGGEEFIALLPDRDGPSAAVIAERLRCRIEQLRVGFEETCLGVTASFGWAHLGEVPPGGEWQELLRRADNRLYQAKLDGRNCVRPLAAASASA